MPPTTNTPSSRHRRSATTGVLLAAAGVLVLGVFGLWSAGSALIVLQARPLAAGLDVHDARQELAHHRRALFEFVIHSADSTAPAGQERVAALETRTSAVIEAYRRSGPGDAPSDRLARFDRAWAAYILSAHDAVTLSDDGRTNDALTQLLERTAPAFRATDEALIELHVAEFARAKAAAEEHTTAVNTRLRDALLSYLLAAALALSLAHPPGSAEAAQRRRR